MGNDFIVELQNYLDATFQLMQDTIIFRALGYRISLWDLYAISTTLIAFFDHVIFPIMNYWGLTHETSESIMDETDPDRYDD